MQLLRTTQPRSLPHSVATFHGVESLILDIRGSLRPVDCVDRKLNKLLAEDSSNAPRSVRQPENTVMQTVTDKPGPSPLARCRQQGMFPMRRGLKAPESRDRPR